ncbi:hypothetical protein GCM10009780_54300 [Actinomadura alba]
MVISPEEGRRAQRTIKIAHAADKSRDDHATCLGKGARRRKNGLIERSSLPAPTVTLPRVARGSVFADTEGVRRLS